MALSLDVIRQIVEQFVRDAAPVEVRTRMQKAVPGIVRKMESQGLNPDSTTLKVLVRDALFKLWRVVIPSGTLADLVRDSIDDKVVDLVTADLSEEEKKDLTTIVEQTMENAISVVF